MSWYVYIAESRFGSYYAGITTDVGKRIISHNTGRGSQMGKQQGPFELVYASKLFPNKSEARKREIQIKGWTREKNKNSLVANGFKF